MDNSYKHIYVVLYLLNLIVIVVVTFTIFTTTSRVCSSFQADDFLRLAGYLPHVPWKVPLYSISLFLFVGVLNFFKYRLNKTNVVTFSIMFFIELLLIFMITFYLNFSYNGLILFLIAGIFFFLPNISLRLFFVSISLICYIFMDYDIIAVRWNFVSFQSYVDHYSPSRQISLYSLKRTLTSVNLMLLILFFYSFIQSKIKENRLYVQLNEKLKRNLFDLEIANSKLEDIAKTKERNRLASEIHDILGHSLTSISTGLEACIELIGDSDTVQHQYLCKIKDISDSGLNDIRRSVKELSIDALQKHSLLQALDDLVNDMNLIGSHRAKMEITGKPTTLQIDEEQTVYRIVQECMTNSRKYSNSAHINIELGFHQNELSLVISDDGQGCARIKKNFGLRHIEERVNILGGCVVFESDTDAGFKTMVKLPLRR